MLARESRVHATLPHHQGVTKEGWAEVRAAVNTSPAARTEDGWGRIERPGIVVHPTSVDVESARLEDEDFDGWGVRAVDWHQSVAECGERDPERNITTPCEREWNGKVRAYGHP